jgi:ParB-like chromosome segregation protein Spo0J
MCHIAAHDASSTIVLKGEILIPLFFLPHIARALQLLLLPSTILLLLHSIANASASLRMRFKCHALHNPMTKHSVKKQVAGWTASKTTEADLKKVKKDGFLSKSAEASSPAMRSFPAQTKAFG